MGLLRNLSTEEIVAQLFKVVRNVSLAQARLVELAGLKGNRVSVDPR